MSSLTSRVVSAAAAAGEADAEDLEEGGSLSSQLFDEQKDPDRLRCLLMLCIAAMGCAAGWRQEGGGGMAEEEKGVEIRQESKVWSVELGDGRASKTGPSLRKLVHSSWRRAACVNRRESPVCFELGRSSAPGQLSLWRAQLSRFGHQLLRPTLDTSVTHNRFYDLMEACFVAGFRSHNSLPCPHRLSSEADVETGLDRLECAFSRSCVERPCCVVLWSRSSRCVVMLPFVVSQS